MNFLWRTIHEICNSTLFFIFMVMVIFFGGMLCFAYGLTKMSQADYEFRAASRCEQVLKP